MGGAKKKSPAQQEKTQKSEPKATGKKQKGKESTGPPKAEITVILTDAQADKAMKGAKVVTVPELARQAGVKASAANAYLRRACEAGTFRRAGGHSGHWIYARAESVSTSPAPTSSSPPS